MLKYVYNLQQHNIDYSIETEFDFDLPSGFIVITDIPFEFSDLTEIYIKNGSVLKRQKKPSEIHLWDELNESWVLNIALVRDLKALEIDRACKTTILSGFTSSALGTPHTYPSRQTDQSNMIASVTASYNPANPSDWATKFWCANSAGVWELRVHTTEQIRKAGDDGFLAIRSAIDKNAQLQAQILAATTNEQLEAINW